MKSPLCAGLALVLLAAGCTRKDPRFEKLVVGISKDSAATLMGVEKPQRVDPFLVNGKYIEVLYYRPPQKSDSLADRKLSPLVSANGVLIGWGWKTLDSVAAATKIPVAPR